MESNIEKIIFSTIDKNLNILGMTIDDITFDTDLLKSGIIDSLILVELIVELGQATGTSIRNLLNDEDELLITINWFLKKFNIKIIKDFKNQ